MAVPLWMDQLRNCTPEQVLARASRCATVVGSQGDALQFGGKGCATAFNALAEGLACAALTAQGGVDFVGLHWCTRPACRAASRYDHADEYPATTPATVPAPRPVVDLHLPEDITS
ncbi:hypothetical protein [Peterkaempfera griseoplana]|uniref:hypothetical protein n=1 Tax=Peterkaempfera griseoplana TaxID=66896 RepID=UPI0012FE8336|nr:hypothetical protein [Peterkaempfera griseoplana]